MQNLYFLYINLFSNYTRNSNIINQFDTFNIKPIRIDACNLNNIIYKNNLTKNGNLDCFNFQIKQNTIFSPRNKEIAIILSHLKALKYIIDNDLEHAFILEDDVSLEFISDINIFKDIIDKRPVDCNIIKFHVHNPKEIQYNINLFNKNIEFVEINKNCLSSCAFYFITNKKAKEIYYRYFNSDLFTFPYKNEFCVAEHIIFTHGNTFVYTKPIITIMNNNLTETKTMNMQDFDANKIIYKYWNKSFEFIVPKNNSKFISIKDKTKKVL